MKTIISLLVLILFATTLKGQPNLIPNPSLEQYYSCPDNTAQVDSCIGWNMIWETPDYFNACTNTWFIDVPSNFMGIQYPFDGNAYLGLAMYVPNSPLYREIVGAYLIDSLITGNLYEFSIRIVRSGFTNSLFSYAASNKFSVKFSMNKPIAFDSIQIDNNPTLFSDSIITDTTNWNLLSWQFIADSNYKYIMIGNFFDNQNTDTLILPPDTGFIYNTGRTYYFIDSLNLKCIGSNCVSAIIKTDDDKNYCLLNLANKTVNFSEGEFARIVLTDSLGKIVLNIDSKRLNSLSTAELFNGLYYFIGYDQNSNKICSQKIFINH